MSGDCEMSRLTKAAQARLFRLAERDHGLTRKVLHLETRIPMSTLKSWATDTEMPVSGLNRLSCCVPDYLLSLLTEPGNKCVTTPEEGDGDLDTLAREASHFVADYVHAKSDGNVTPIEKARLHEDRRRVRAAAA